MLVWALIFGVICRVSLVVLMWPIVIAVLMDDGSTSWEACSIRGCGEIMEIFCIGCWLVVWVEILQLYGLGIKVGFEYFWWLSWTIGVKQSGWSVVMTCCSWVPPVV